MKTPWQRSCAALFGALVIGACTCDPKRGSALDITPLDVVYVGQLYRFKQNGDPTKDVAGWVRFTEITTQRTDSSGNTVEEVTGLRMHAVAVFAKDVAFPGDNAFTIIDDSHQGHWDPGVVNPSPPRAHDEHGYRQPANYHAGDLGNSQTKTFGPYRVAYIERDLQPWVDAKLPWKSRHLILHVDRQPDVDAITNPKPMLYSDPLSMLSSASSTTPVTASLGGQRGTKYAVQLYRCSGDGSATRDLVGTAQFEESTTSFEGDGDGAEAGEGDPANDSDFGSGGRSRFTLKLTLNHLPAGAHALTIVDAQGQHWQPIGRTHRIDGSKSPDQCHAGDLGEIHGPSGGGSCTFTFDLSSFLTHKIHDKLAGCELVIDQQPDAQACDDAKPWARGAIR